MYAYEDPGNCLDQYGVYKQNRPLPKRIITFRDVHRDPFALKGVLKFLHVADVQLSDNGFPISATWLITDPDEAANTVAVFTGDLLDRGPRGLSLFAVLFVLHRQAHKHRSDLVIILGNHNAMAMTAHKTYIQKNLADGDLLEFLRKGDERGLNVPYQELVQYRDHWYLSVEGHEKYLDNRDHA